MEKKPFNLLAFLTEKEIIDLKIKLLENDIKIKDVGTILAKLILYDENFLNEVINDRTKTGCYSGSN